MKNATNKAMHRTHGGCIPSMAKGGGGKGSGPANGPSQTGKESGTGRGNNPPSK